jgi:hypothetical protein
MRRFDRKNGGEGSGRVLSAHPRLSSLLRCALPQDARVCAGVRKSRRRGRRFPAGFARTPGAADDNPLIAIYESRERRALGCFMEQGCFARPVNALTLL